jgi:hypothetical protein
MAHLAQTDRGAMRRPGSVAALVIAATVVVGLLVGCSATSGTLAAHRATPSYGTLPDYLKSQSLTADRVLEGSAAHPALTTEGDQIRIGRGKSAALVTVTGPEVPGEGLPYQATATTCTWTITITSGSAPVPIDIADFSTIDHLGAVYRPAPVAGQPAPPATLAAHATTTFELRGVMLVGEGLMRWAPDGHHIVGEWDFEVEND